MAIIIRYYIFLIKPSYSDKRNYKFWSRKIITTSGNKLNTLSEVGRWKFCKVCWWFVWCNMFRLKRIPTKNYTKRFKNNIWFLFNLIVLILGSSNLQLFELILWSMQQVVGEVLEGKYILTDFLAQFNGNC